MDAATEPRLSGVPTFPLGSVAASNTDAAPHPPETAAAASVFTIHRIKLDPDETTTGLVRFICLGCHTLQTLPVVDGRVTCHCGERYQAETA